MNADLDAYSTVGDNAHEPRHVFNELLYALKEAPKLSCRFMPNEVVEQVATGKKEYVPLAVMAAKSENTKAGRKIRCTWSADDCTREMITGFNRAAIPLSSLYTGVTSRKSDIRSESVMSRTCDDLDQTGVTLVISQDAAGWSDKGDRKYWSMHHDYILATTKCRNDIGLERIWEGVTAVLNKRGHVATSELREGLFQG